MDQRQELIQRALDGELDAAGQRRLQALLAQEPELAQELEQRRQLQQDVHALADVDDPGPALTDQIMAALPAQPDPAPLAVRLRRLIASLARPVQVPAWSAALLLLGLGVALFHAANSRQPAPGRHTDQPTPIAARPDAAPAPAPAPTPPASCPAPRVMVRFMLHAPKASKVALVGDFNDWAVDQTQLADPDQNGIWSVSVPLSPGRYQYKFVLDGKQWVVEPDAAAYHPDGFGGKNSLLEI